MNDITEFLSFVLPSQGYICIAGFKDSRTPTQYLVQTLEEGLDRIRQYAEAKRNVFFAVATFKTPEKRTQANVEYIKSFFLDIDCKETGYQSKEEALSELEKFRTACGLPEPTLVDSGGGYHAYWVLTKSVTAEEWLPIARAFKEACAVAGLRADPVVTADSARILRVPDTDNYKYDPPHRTAVIRYGAPLTFEEFKTCIGQQVVIPDVLEIAPTAKRDGPNTGGWLDPNIESRFRAILEKGDEGCAQLNYAVENADKLEEPFWRAALSVAWRCTDGTRAVRAVSEGYPGYSLNGALAKAEQTKGPYTCETFNTLRPGVCTACPHWGKIKSPILLGRAVIEPDPEPEEESPATPGKPPRFPDLPAGYVRGKTGGIYRKGDDPKLIYENEFHVIDRVSDNIKGETIAFKVAFPNDGERVFTIPMMIIASKDKFREELSRHGMVVFGNKQMDEIMTYVGHWIRKLQKDRSATQSAYQFGWTKQMDMIILGSTGYSPGKMHYCPSSEVTAQFVDSFVPAGSLDEWKQVPEVYNHEGMEPYQFTLCAGFGSLLYPLAGTDGGLLLSVESPESGRGKTYLAYVINSIYGHPRSNVLGAKSTDNAIISRLGVWNHLPVHIDEVTKWPAERLADFIYSFNNGIGKARLNRSGTAERINKTTWRNISIMTSNTMVFSALSTTKALPLGEMMRVMPIRLWEPLASDQAQADALFSKLDTNYGVAGGLWAEYCVSHAAELSEAITVTKARLVEKVGFRHPHRFWLAGIACALVAGSVAVQLGLLPFDMKKVTAWVSKYCETLIAETDAVQERASDGVAIIGDFLAENFNATVVVAGEANKRTLSAVVTPKGNTLNVRVNESTGEVFLRLTAVNEFCRRTGRDLESVKQSLSRQNVPFNLTSCRIGAGTTIDVPTPVRVLRVVLPSWANEGFLANVKISEAVLDSVPEGDKLPDTERTAGA